MSFWHTQTSQIDQKLFSTGPVRRLPNSIRYLAMSAKPNSSSTRNCQPSPNDDTNEQGLKPDSVVHGGAGSEQAGDITAFLLTAARRKLSYTSYLPIFHHSINISIANAEFLPLQPWNVPSGMYTRPDGSTVHVAGQQSFHPHNAGGSTHASTEALVGGYEAEN
jgi:hypothetical protein